MYVYEVAYTIDNESHNTSSPGSGVYTAKVAASSKREAFDKVREVEEHVRRGTGYTPHVARWYGRQKHVRRGTVAEAEIDIT